MRLDVEGCWRSLFKVWPLMRAFEPVPSRLPPWPLRRAPLSCVALPTEAHYGECAAMNPGLRLIEWGEL